MRKYGVPTAAYRSFSDYEEAREYVLGRPFPAVLKYDGLAAGKGVVIAENAAEAEEALKDTRIKVPDEVSEEICPECGRNLVVKSGRFGRFLACPGYPDCSFTMPLVVEMPGRCPKCGGRIMKRTTAITAVNTVRTKTRRTAAILGPGTYP